MANINVFILDFLAVKRTSSHLLRHSQNTQLVTSVSGQHLRTITRYHKFPTITVQIALDDLDNVDLDLGVVMD